MSLQREVRYKTRSDFNRQRFPSLLWLLLIDDLDPIHEKNIIEDIKFFGTYNYLEITLDKKRKWNFRLDETIRNPIVQRITYRFVFCIPHQPQPLLHFYKLGNVGDLSSIMW